MYSANRFPVKLYEGGPVGYAEGGLHDEALAVRRAGRNGDGRLVHVNDDEFAEMVAEYGDPTINPETGMPEFFLGKLGKLLKTIAPIAVSFIPGIGPVAGAALGAGLGALGGGGIKGAILGGISGGLGGAGAAGKLGGTILGNGASAVAQRALGDAVIGGAMGAVTGQDPLKAALMSGGTSFLRGQFAPRAPASSAQGSTASATPAMSSGPDVITQGRGLFDYSMPASAPAGNLSFDTSALGLSPNQYSSFNRALETGLNNGMKTPGTNSFDFSKVGLSPDQMPLMKSVLETGLNNGYAATAPIRMSPAVQASLNTAAANAPAAAPVKFMDRDFLGIKGLPNKYGLGASALAAAAAYDLLKPKDKNSTQTPEEFFGPTFSGSGGRPAGGFRLASNPMPATPESGMSDYGKRYLSGYALGGDVGDEGRSEGNSFAVQGKGTGRSDEIPAMLSDGEYVIDAETVALLGDGSSKAGAKKLDDFRVKIRKQKGKRLAKGKFSHDAKHPEKYMAGGRI